MQKRITTLGIFAILLFNITTKYGIEISPAPKEAYEVPERKQLFCPASPRGRGSHYMYNLCELS
jgi:hypothetical protein